MSDVWVGLAHLTGTFNEDRIERGAYVHAVAIAADEPDLRDKVDAATRELGYLLLELEAVEPLADRAERRHASYALLELGVRAARGNVEFGVFHIYESDDDEDDEDAEESEDLGGLLFQAEVEGQIVKVHRRPVPDEPTHGFVSVVGETWVVLQTIDARMRLDGYSAIRLEDVTDCRSEDDHSFTAKALSLRGDRPARPGVDATGLANLLSSAQRQFGLVSIFIERHAPDVCYIGRVLEVNSTDLTLEPIDPEARWQEPEVYELHDITRVDFGGSYEQALALVAATAD
jgi:hypothetical protein